MEPKQSESSIGQSKPKDGESSLEQKEKKELEGNNANEESDEETRSYICCFSPKWLQRLRTPRVMIAWMCCASFLQGFIVNGMVHVVISTIERRYKMRSTQVGFIASGYDVASLCLLVPVSYLGGSRNKPRFVAIGVIVLGIGALVFSSPYFLSGKYEFSRVDEKLCGNVTEHCTKDTSSALSKYRFVFFLGQFLHGAGAAPLWTLGCAYIDENVSRSMSSLYIALYYTASLIGPGVGYMLGGRFLSIYVDWVTTDTSKIGLTPYSEVWVGAWWIGFIIGGFFAILVSIPIWSFPKMLPGSKTLRLNDTSEVHEKNLKTKAMEKGFGKKISDLPASFRILMGNPTFIFLSFAAAVEGMIASGMAAFLPKIIERQFSISSGSAALLVGGISIPGAAGGTFLGGCIVQKLDLKVKQILKLIAFITMLSTTSSMFLLISCENTQLVGYTATYGNQTYQNQTYQNQTYERRENLNSSCNADCACSSLNYDPICGVDNNVYFSPCYAGCHGVHFHGDTKYYTNCTCLEEKNISTSFPYKTSYLQSFRDKERLDAVRAKCAIDCGTLPVFAALGFVAMFLTFAISMPSLTATLRCVAQSQKSFALGIQWVVVRLFGTIPSPFIFGLFIDLSCSLWQKTCDKGTGSCILYNNLHLSLYMVFLVLGLKLVSLSLFLMAYMFYKAPDTTVEDVVPTDK